MLPLSTENRRAEVLRNKLIMQLTASYDFYPSLISWWEFSFNLFYQLVEFGKEILAIVPGRVSTEVDARLSFDKEATKAKVYWGFVCGINSIFILYFFIIRQSNSLLYTSLSVSKRIVSWSRLHRLGKVSKQPASLSVMTIYTVTSPYFSPSDKP